jgi:CDP-diacylglycerol--serine O-phosphatidyltransferase
MTVPPLPTLITCGNLAAGFLAVLLAIRGDFTEAAALVLVAATLDLLDGVVARKGDCDGDFGGNLDSLADSVSFGVAPAIAIYLSALTAIPIFGLVACIFYVVCGALRLARFPLVKRPKHFVGLPIPPAGVMLAGLTIPNLNPLLVLASILILSILMVSTLPIPKLSGISLPGRSRDKKRPTAEEI